MLKLTLEKFKSLSKETKSMVALYWVYDFAQVLINTFLGIFIFLQTDSIVQLAIYNIFYFFGIALGFSIWGAVLAYFKMSMRLNYLRAFVTFIISFLILIFFPHTNFFLHLFGLINGMGLGMFWVGVHSYEMIFTDDSNRDFYSSMTSAGSQAIAIISPLIATITFFIAEQILHVETFKIFFAVIPCIYLLAVPFIFSLPDYYPEKIPLKEWKRLFCDKKIKKARRYYFTQGIGWGVYAPTIAIVAISSMETVIKVGLLQTIVGLTSILTIIFLSHKRHEGNRVNIMLYAVIAESFCFLLLLFWEVSPIIYIIFSLAVVIIYPIYRVSEHVIDLKSVEMIKEKEHTSFYGGMLYRDLVLTFSRMFGVAIVLALATAIDTMIVIKIAIIIAAINNFFIWLTARSLINSNIELPKKDYLLTDNV